ncbi:polysaccharide polymerase [Acetobacter sp.]|jgi:putative polymerase|uniref:polysaccharide polymerase n=1 Tax=Acetobacter sp. TaxID=440 RepID=UPI0025BE6F67|nr:polysaccharide polymerase [Acetobacter sp.]MCH4090374.1 polysaccharide polymerase [Acetobacter sp.]MCI1299068.1 polysaccharide polymerase [Acetobacter sp.]MCI1315615.1 polysaccharide polymerase [Acetobacter sp.]
MTVTISQFGGQAEPQQSRREAVSSSSFSAGKWLVIASIMFNPFLCFLDTKGILHASNGIIVISELFIIFAATWIVRKNITSIAVILSILISGYVIAAHLINQAVTLKILHDLWIPYVFYLLGSMTSIKTARETLWISISLVLFFAFFELLAFDLYGHFFNIWQYYVDKGAVGSDVINYRQTTSFVSGARGTDARTYFPSLLGPVRISSVFLEPVSMGNFATIVFAWGLITWENRRNEHSILLMALGFLCIILTDSRFATGCCVLLVLVRLLPLARSSFFVFILPILIMVTLTVVGSGYEISGTKPGILSDDFKGRLLFSGRLLDDWSLVHWFGFADSPVYTADTGYAYLFNNLGLPLSIVLFAVIAFHRTGNSEAMIMKSMMAVYFGTSLCIGANAVTIKTGALCWFLYGAIDKIRLFFKK